MKYNAQKYISRLRCSGFRLENAGASCFKAVAMLGKNRNVETVQRPQQESAFHLGCVCPNWAETPLQGSNDQAPKIDRQHNQKFLAPSTQLCDSAKQDCHKELGRCNTQETLSRFSASYQRSAVSFSIAKFRSC